MTWRPLPDIQLITGGAAIGGVLQATIFSTNCFSADTFAVTLALGAPPLTNAAFWSNVASTTIEIHALSIGVDECLIVGVIDSISFDPCRGIVTIEGRDLSARLVDSYRQQDFVNQTASEVVTAIAQQNGLSAVVTPTIETIGRYYGDGFTRLSLGQFSRFRSDWDVVVQLARDNGFDTFVSGQSLFFQPTTTLVGIPLLLDVSQLQSVRFERNLTLGTNPTSCLQSWNSQEMAGYQSQTQLEQSASDAATFLFTGSNLTSAQVDSATDSLNAELGRLSSVFSCEMPWRTDIEPRCLIRVSGTESSFDTLYEVDSVERSYSVTCGASQRIRAIGVSSTAAS